MGSAKQTQEFGRIGGLESAVDFVLPRALMDVDGSPHIYHPTIEIFSQNSQANDVFLIERGLVKRIRVEKNGREVIIDLRFPGWTLGAASVIFKQPHPVTAITLTNCHLRRIPARIFQHLVQTDEQVSWYLHQLHSREVLDKAVHVASLGCLTARARLVHLLQRLISELTERDSQGDIRVQLPLKYWEIAQLVAITPEHLSRLLKQMQHEGIVRQEKGWLIITDSEQLLRLVADK